jgi:hypothetical protein
MGFALLVLGTIIFLIVYCCIFLPIQAGARFIGEATEASASKNRRQIEEQRKRSVLNSISSDRGRVRIDITKSNQQVQGYTRNNNLELVSYEDSDYVKSKFPHQFDHAYWRFAFINKLEKSEKSKWEKILNLSWEAVRLLESQARILETDQDQTAGVMKFADKALVSLYYLSTHCNNASLSQEIQEEIDQCSEDLRNTSDRIEKESLNTIIKTYQMRLQEQKQIEMKLKIIDNEIKSLEASFKLIIEGVQAKISGYNLESTSDLALHDQNLLSLKLPIMDQIFISYSNINQKSN